MALILPACGAAGGDERWREIRGIRFSANVPADWDLERPPRTIAAARPDGPEAVSVGVFRLARPFKPALWDEAVGELDDVAARLAERLGPSARIEEKRTGTIARRRARIYEIRYRREGEVLIDRVAFVLVGRREYQLTCRISVDDRAVGARACEELYRSFRVR